MKKKIILLTTFLISFIIFTYNVEADKYMYLECELSDDDCVFGYNRNCVNGYDTFAPLTDNEGKVKTYGFYFDPDGNLPNSEYVAVSTDCWLKEIGSFSNCVTSILDDYNLVDLGEVKISDILNKGICPVMVATPTINVGIPNELIPVKVSKTNKVPKDKKENYIISEPTFAFYEINGKMIAEGYSENGAYSYVGPDIVQPIFDEVRHYQFQRIFELRQDYWKVYDYKAQMVSANLNHAPMGTKVDGVDLCNGITKEECENKHGYKLYYDSIDSNKNIENGIIDWYGKQKEATSSLSAAAKIIDNNKLLEECKNINDEGIFINDYSFKNYNSASSFISNVEKVYEAMKMYYGQSQPIDYCTQTYTEPISSAISYLYKQADFCEINDLKFEDDNEHGVNEDKLYKNFANKVKNVAKNSNNEEIVFAFNYSEKIKDYFDEVYKAIYFMSSFPDKFNLSSEETSKLNTLKDNMKNLGEGKGLNTNIVFTCDDLFGETLINKINSYLKIIKIVIPILLLAFGILDFFKATFASDEEAMTKAKKTFIKRLGIAVLIFLVPTFVDLLLKLANNVWSTITPNSCNIYK